MDRFVQDALVLSHVDYGEADRIVTLFTRGRGRLSAFAAGARKSKRRFAGALEPGTLVRAQLVESRGETVRLDGVDVLQLFHHLREDLPRIARSLYCLELCRELLRDAQPHEELFDALLAYLTLLDQGGAGPTSLIKFELDALAHTGFMPHFSPCVLCERPLGDRPRFDPLHGGSVCDDCAQRVKGATAVPPALLLSLHRIQQGERLPLDAPTRAQARRLLNSFIAHQLGRSLKSVEFMEQIGAD